MNINSKKRKDESEKNIKKIDTIRYVDNEVYANPTSGIPKRHLRVWLGQSLHADLRSAKCKQHQT
jgi:hypothetical protein